METHTSDSAQSEQPKTALFNVIDPAAPAAPPVKPDEPQKPAPARKAKGADKKAEPAKKPVKPAPGKSSKKGGVIAAAVVALMVIIGGLWWFNAGRDSKPKPVAAAVAVTAPAPAPVAQPAQPKGPYGLEEDPMNWPVDQVVKVKAGERLTVLAKRYYGAKPFWVYLYLANRNTLDNPNRVAENQKINLPKVPAGLTDASSQTALDQAKAIEKQLKQKYD